MNLSGHQLVEQLRQRGLVAQISGDSELASHLDKTRTLYCGFDPTADSLHIGSLVPLLILKRFQMAGHRPIILVGGSTGLIGDPSFKAEERKLNTPEVVADWVEKLKRQTSQFVDFDQGNNAAVVVNNLDWTEEMTALDFLRDVGKHFSVNNMIAKESVKQRLGREGAGISFTEFAYSLLQGLDFAELNRRYDCTLQVGGSDQWGNIISGIDLCRRQNKAQCFALTAPLVTKADGSKFGKTETGTVWLDPSKTSPYSFYQFWLNVADADVYKFLSYFTFLPLEQIQAIQAKDALIDGRPEGQSILAREATSLVHGDEGLNAALRITEALFSGNPADLSESDFEQLSQDGLPFSQLSNTDFADKPLTNLLTDAGMAKAGREVKDALARTSVFINGVAKGFQDNMGTSNSFAVEHALYGRFFLVRLGKKKYHLFELI
ncbi:MAG: tyrosine--tRNA ligase [Proteobacteria bacterium]|jgi:tyrosyl-tRNA synthetase|uniref:Tyrosine--tRNA ligase n=1 Tax=SAR92 bacterium BACL26 MAG-121220-bin70 TaxID=1655626 RepID=A0A0R2U2I2_9GAMM|nr:MAG: tyrosine--tRNA ligase [SAR92 bacterium BACL26 MAG-121220-bin70]MDA0796174.1 tyrosine--tRNA ligase [Pseudomonadota bacterium]MDA1351660.1 tyrosine--tRNA ligase [Pseudomonadota bacterium]